MQKIKRFWRVGAFIILLLFIALGALDFIWTNAANRPAHEWEVELPQNGQLTYRVGFVVRIPFLTRSLLFLTLQTHSSASILILSGFPNSFILLRTLQRTNISVA